MSVKIDRAVAAPLPPPNDAPVSLPPVEAAVPAAVPTQRRALDALVEDFSSRASIASTSPEYAALVNQIGKSAETFLPELYKAIEPALLHHLRLQRNNLTPELEKALMATLRGLDEPTARTAWAAIKEAVHHGTLPAARTGPTVLEAVVRLFK